MEVLLGGQNTCTNALFGPFSKSFFALQQPNYPFRQESGENVWKFCGGWGDGVLVRLHIYFIPMKSRKTISQAICPHQFLKRTRTRSQ